ncbi:hypothetical protein AA23498_1148 [Acetobacter nitrogenifigens DSM 23921 = NBRC 105050]|uniref:DUF2274 domain-containing protein n=1 Tax=Acetobacter nitrogenifigens DSM 23921 = NBRC 105050 TaxID=1120919 RepID=A0A511XAD5_9PROT|nr:DUF2274 domain-containing protein [Acetobacter nitrogenifigens]GBQ91316.1 hypothetical protein AA23498_1148 [Acetobacter nitrogenifigens DSM 23921 = NBRC 105050]GEN59923.1 hypothetical protein ANI02nite_18070 [Acetobacter nitrogenifigens DSM 23921 = NBRC 105050]
MTKLRITEIPDEKPVRVTLDLPADLHRDLVAYAALVSQNGQHVDPARLVPHMIRGFIASDRAFRKLRQGARRAAIKTLSPAAPEHG